MDIGESSAKKQRIMSDGASSTALDSDCLSEMVERLSAEGLGRQRHTANARLRSLVQRRAGRLLSQINKRIDELSAEWRRRAERLVELCKQEYAKAPQLDYIEKELAEFFARTVEALPQALAMFSPSLAEAISVLKRKDSYAIIAPNMLPSRASDGGEAMLSGCSAGEEPNWSCGYVGFNDNGQPDERKYHFLEKVNSFSSGKWITATEAQWKLVGELQLLHAKKATLTAGGD